MIYSFGREDQIDRIALERLAQSIIRFLSPEEALRAQENISEASDFVFESSKRLGGTWTLHQIWHKLGLDDILKELLTHRNHETNIERLFFSMVANRALAPTSKLAMEDWVADDVVIPGLSQVTSHQLYRAMDVLLEVRNALEEKVYFSVADLLNLEVDLIYFDTTSSYFEVEPYEAPDGEILRQLGYSKDHRLDLLQVVIGMAVTREGIPIRCWVWPGNTANVNVVEEVKKDLVGWRLGRVVSVVDRGFSSESNYHRLEERIQSHILLNWLALLLVRIAEYETKQTWRNLRRTLEQIHLGHYSSKKGTFDQRTELIHKQRQILGALGVEAPPKIFDIQSNS